MADIYIKIENNKVDEILRQLDDKCEKALKSIGMECEGYAKKDCPVDTGRLRASIAWATKHDTGNTDTAKEAGDDKPQSTPKDKSVYIGSNVEYAVKQEFGDYHHTVGKKHYLKDAAANHSDHYKAILKAALDS